MFWTGIFSPVDTLFITINIYGVPGVPACLYAKLLYYFWNYDPSVHPSILSSIHFLPVGKGGLKPIPDATGQKTGYNLSIYAFYI